MKHIQVRSVVNGNAHSRLNIGLRARVLLAAGLLLVALLSGCDSFLGLPFQQGILTPTSPPDISANETATLPPHLVLKDLTPEPEEAALAELVIWVPPFMSPDAGTRDGALLAQRLADFELANPGVDVILRVKAASGPASQLEFLTATSATIPLAMPSLVMISRSDLELAAKRGLVLPISGYSIAINDLDWFPYARTMAVIGDSTFGLPFAGSTLVMVYRESAFVENPFPRDWTGLFESGTPVFFAAGDASASLVTNYYLAQGGSIRGEDDRPTLDEEALTYVLRIFEEGKRAGVFSAPLMEYSNTSQVWDAFMNGETNVAVVWSSHILPGDLPEDMRVVPLLPVSPVDYTLADGWLLALADPLPERRELAVRLAEFLIDIEFLADWSFASGNLPMREGALDLWDNRELRDAYTTVSYSARMLPAQDAMNVIAPLLSEALGMVLLQDMSPELAVEAVMQKFHILQEQK